MFKKVGTFWDSEVCVEYDLCIVNAIEFKGRIEESYNLSPLKLNMFNQGTQALRDIEKAMNYYGADIDIENGNIKSINSDSMKGIGFFNTAEELTQSSQAYLNDSLNEYHLLGYELLPLVISLKDKSLDNFESVELIDGFKRIFWTKNVPNRDVFVKVYDTLSDREWINAMLLYNSWKLNVGDRVSFDEPLAGISRFMDRGFALGLYRHFGFDLTLEGTRGLHYYATYFSRDPYCVLKNNGAIINDIRFISNVFECLIPNKNNHPTFNNQIILSVVIALRESRIAEYRENFDRGLLSVDFSSFKAFIETPEIKKHISHVSSLKIPGTRENYAKKHLLPAFVLYFANCRKSGI